MLAWSLHVQSKLHRATHKKVEVVHSSRSLEGGSGEWGRGGDGKAFCLTRAEERGRDLLVVLCQLIPLEKEE